MGVRVCACVGVWVWVGGWVGGCPRLWSCAHQRLTPRKPLGISFSEYLQTLLPYVCAHLHKFVPAASDLLCCHFQKLLGLTVQFEQTNTTLSFLEAELTSTAYWGPISTKTPTLRSTAKTPASIEKWLDPWALNADSMLRSMVPNCVKKVQHLRLCPAAVHKSFATLVLCLALEYETNWWKNSLFLGARKWGLVEYLRHALSLVKQHLSSPAPNHDLSLGVFLAAASRSWVG